MHSDLNLEGQRSFKTLLKGDHKKHNKSRNQVSSHVAHFTTLYQENKSLKIGYFDPKSVFQIENYYIWITGQNTNRALKLGV